MIQTESLEETRQGRSFQIRVSPIDQGKRLDQFLAGTDLRLSRSQVKKRIEEGAILLNGKTAKPGVQLRSGDQVSGTLPVPAPLVLTPEPLPLSILYEDPSLIVIDKPAGMVVHPAPGNFTGTLVHALLHHCRDLTGINGVLRPGIVHRLDKETSGVMVVAKSDEAYHHLTKQFKNRTLNKVYLAIARGTFHPDEGIIDLAIGRHPKERKRMSAHSPRGREAVTAWKVLERFRGAMLLEIHPRTGRTHQIRVHLAALGHPVLGDPLYGGRKAQNDPMRMGPFRILQRQALHAYRLGLTHPLTGDKVEFIAPLPQDMKAVLDQLRSEGTKG